LLVCLSYFLECEQRKKYEVCQLILENSQRFLLIKNVEKIKNAFL
jgi:hypothetical protein